MAVGRHANRTGSTEGQLNDTTVVELNVGDEAHRRTFPKVLHDGARPKGHEQLRVPIDFDRSLGGALAHSVPAEGVVDRLDTELPGEFELLVTLQSVVVRSTLHPRWDLGQRVAGIPNGAHRALPGAINHSCSISAQCFAFLYGIGQ